MSLLIVGGCHVSGYKVPPRTSFAELLGSYLHTGSKCLSPLPLKRHTLIHEAIVELHPEIVVLQLGNYEFHGSLKRLFKTHQKPAKGIPERPVSESRSEPVPAVSRESMLNKAVRYALMPMFVLYLIFRNRAFLNSIRSYVDTNRSSRFIILTPIPCLTFSDNITRRIAGKYFRIKFASMSNVTFVDLYAQGQLFGMDCYSDASHLNEKGHKALFEHIVGSL